MLDLIRKELRYRDLTGGETKELAIHPDAYDAFLDEVSAYCCIAPRGGVVVKGALYMGCDVYAGTELDFDPRLVTI